MSMRLGNQAQRADINVTPLIDVELRPFGLQSNCCHQPSVCGTNKPAPEALFHAEADNIVEEQRSVPLNKARFP